MQEKSSNLAANILFNSKQYYAIVELLVSFKYSLIISDFGNAFGTNFIILDYISYSHKVFLISGDN